MFNQESGLVFRIEQLEQNQQVLALDMAEMKRQLQSALSQLHQQFDESSAPPTAPVVVVNESIEESSCVDEPQPQQQPPQTQSYKYQLVFDRSGSRAVLMSALEKAQKRLIIVCPWLSRNSIDADLMQKFRDCLNRNCRIDIGWGYLSKRNKNGKAWGNSAIRDLRQLEQDYPEQFKLKLLGTHEKFLVCDSYFAMLGSHNMLTSNTQGATREVGIRTTDSNIIQGLIDRFDGAEVQDAQAIDERLTAGFVNLDDAEIDEDEETDDSVSYSQTPAVDAEDFLRRYNEKERDFIGINLARVDLTSAKLSGVNLTEANLSGTNLTKADLRSANLLQANLSKANLCGADLRWGNLTTAYLSRVSASQTLLTGGS